MTQLKKIVVEGREYELLAISSIVEEGEDGITGRRIQLKGMEVYAAWYDAWVLQERLSAHPDECPDGVKWIAFVGNDRSYIVLPSTSMKKPGEFGLDFSLDDSGCIARLCK